MVSTLLHSYDKIHVGFRSRAPLPSYLSFSLMKPANASSSRRELSYYPKVNSNLRTGKKAMDKFLSLMIESKIEESDVVSDLPSFGNATVHTSGVVETQTIEHEAVSDDEIQLPEVQVQPTDSPNAASVPDDSLQALARGREIRHSDIGVEENKLPDDDTYLGIKKLTANAFAQKVMLVKTITMSESRSSCLVRELVSFWKPVPQPNKTSVKKTQKKFASNSQIVEGEYGKPKKNVRKVPTSNLENASDAQTAFEFEKPKRSSFRKFSTSQSVELPPPVETPQVDLEKPQPVPQKEVEKPAPALEEPVEDAFDEEKTDEKGETVVEQPEELKHIHEPVVTNETLDSTLVNQIEESEENVIPEREDVKEERTPKQKNKETPNSSQGLPSYMQATKSAKAKLRLQGSSSPKQQGTEKATRRYWLPSSGNNARVTSDSPKTTRVSNSGGKTGKKTEKPLLNGMFLLLGNAFFVLLQMDNVSSLRWERDMMLQLLSVHPLRVLEESSSSSKEGNVDTSGDLAPSVMHDPNQSVKRKIGRGSDPIHNRC
ncbi:hypothetical protein Bca101_066581 [Brassica carinata]